jgi:hypothetical protein
MIVSFQNWVQKVSYLRFLMPLFPVKTLESDTLYWLSFGIALFLTISFYLLGFYFVFLAISDKFSHIIYLVLALVWILIAAILPAGAYRLVLFYLRKNNLLD